MVAVIDIDHFKNVNDRLGHDVGDAVLVRVADALRECSRADDLLVRLGGEELAWVTTWPDVAAAVTGAERLRVLVRERTAELGVLVTVSIGVARVAEVPTGTGPAVFPVGAVEDHVRHALNRADQALYRAKAAGRDRVETASEDVAEEGFEQRSPR